MIDVKKLFLDSWGKCTYNFQPSDKIKIFTIETKSLNYVQGTHGYFGKLLLGSFVSLLFSGLSNSNKKNLLQLGLVLDPSELE